MSDLGENPTLRDAIENAIIEWDDVLVADEQDETLTDVVERHVTVFLAKSAARELVVPSPQPADEEHEAMLKLGYTGVHGWYTCDKRGNWQEIVSRPAAVSSLTPNETDLT